MEALNNFKRSGSKYLILSVQPSCEVNTDINTGECRPINFLKPPYSFPKPIYDIDEGFYDKHLYVWKLKDLESK